MTGFVVQKKDKMAAGKEICCNAGAKAEDNEDEEIPVDGNMYKVGKFAGMMLALLDTSQGEIPRRPCQGKIRMAPGAPAVKKKFLTCHQLQHPVQALSRHGWFSVAV